MLGRRLARGRFPKEPAILKILHKDCFIWAKVPNLEVPRLSGLVPQAQNLQKIAFGILQACFSIVFSFAFSIAIQQKLS